MRTPIPVLPAFPVPPTLPLRPGRPAPARSGRLPGLRRAAAAIALAPLSCGAYTLDFQSEPAASGPGNAYVVANGGICGTSARCEGPWGDPITNEQGLNCGGTGNYSARLDWADGTGALYLVRTSMGRTQGGGYRCEGELLGKVETDSLHGSQVLHLHCDAAASCRAWSDDAARDLLR